MGLLISMSFAGSIAVVLYLLLKPFLKKNLTARLRYQLLSMALLFYLVPFQLGKRIYIDSLKLFSIFAEKKEVVNLSKNIIQITPSGYVYFTAEKTKTIVFTVWFLIMMIILCWGSIDYYRQKKRLILFSNVILDTDLISSIERIKKQLKIKRKISYRSSSSVKEPLTIGTLKPILVLPDYIFQIKERKLIYNHELLHIKNYDSLFKILGFLTIALHWYNPLVYILVQEIGLLSESTCDENIAFSIKREQRVEYGNLILQMMTKIEKSSNFFSTSFCNNRKKAEERILYMLNVKEKTVKGKIMAICLFIMIGMMSSLTVFAYEKPTVLKVNSKEDITKVSNKEEITTVFVMENASMEEVSQGDSEIFFISNSENKLPSEIYFIDEAGNTYSSSEQLQKIGCTHTYVKGTLNEHIKQGVGCTIYVYSAQRCTICGVIIKGALENTINYAKCPH